MLTIELHNGKRHVIDLFSYKAEIPRIPRKSIKAVIVRDMVLEVVRVKLLNIPDVKDAREVIYPGDLGLFVLENLLAWHREDERLLKGKK